MVYSAGRATFVALWAGATLAAAIGFATGAQAAGALAIGIKNNDAGQGLSYGLSANYPTDGDAKYEALSACLEFLDAPAEVRAACKIVATFHRQCVAVALDQKAGTPGWGWSQADDKDGAQKTAIKNCRAIAGADRADYCEITHAECDGGEPRVAERPSPEVRLSTETAKPQSVSGGRR